MSDGPLGLYSIQLTGVITNHLSLGMHQLRGFKLTNLLSHASPWSLGCYKFLIEVSLFTSLVCTLHTQRGITRIDFGSGLV